MSDFAAWLVGLVKDLLKAVWDIVVDLAIEIVDLVLAALLVVVSALPVPSFTGGFANALSGISPGVWFFASHFRIGECLAVLGAAFAFRLARKAVTLFQW